MDIVRLHEEALDETARLVDGVRLDQLGGPTPCSEWDVRALLDHLVAGNVRFATLATGRPPESGPASEGLPDDDPAGAYRRTAEALKEAWRDPALLDRQFEMPFGAMPGRAALGLHLVETVTHAWDLAKATGQRPDFAPGVVQTASQLAQSRLPSERPPDMPFAAPVPVADDAPEIDRFAAFMGRDPSWG